MIFKRIYSVEPSSVSNYLCQMTFFTAMPYRIKINVMIMMMMTMRIKMMRMMMMMLFW